MVRCEVVCHVAFPIFPCLARCLDHPGLYDHRRYCIGVRFCIAAFQRLEQLSSMSRRFKGPKWAKCVHWYPLGLYHEGNASRDPYWQAKVASEIKRNPAYGQYLDARPGTMQNAVELHPEYGAHIAESKLCAACHNLNTPIVSPDGERISQNTDAEFPEQPVYNEWEHSSFARLGE